MTEASIPAGRTWAGGRVDVLECPRCGGRLELIAFIAEPGVAKRILDHLGLASQGPPLRLERLVPALEQGRR